MERPRPSRRLRDLLQAGEVRLGACGIERPRLEAEVLMAEALGVDRGRLAMMLAAAPGPAGSGPVVGVPAAVAFRRMVKRRALREPLAYITGRREFWSLDFEVTPAVLIPRPETELLVEEALAALPGGGAALVVDAGTGSGAVAVALAVERPAAVVVATDISEAALAVARRNAARHGLSSRIHLVRGDLLAPLRRPVRDGGRPLMVVSNPPYVSPAERDSLMPEVRDWEPAEALYAGEAGMAIIGRLVPQAVELLAEGEWLMMEVASARAADVARALTSSGRWQDVSVRSDYSGLPRVVKGRRSR